MVSKTALFLFFLILGCNLGGFGVNGRTIPQKTEAGQLSKRDTDGDEPKPICINYYEIKAGDTCYNIAVTKHLCLNEIYEINQGINCDNLQIGQKICLAQATPARFFPPRPKVEENPHCKQFYTMASENGCWEMGFRFGPKRSEIEALNPGLKCHELRKGDRICKSMEEFIDYSSCAELYTITESDTCYSIQMDKGVSMDSLYALNPGLDCSRLRIGSNICLSSTPRRTENARPKKMTSNQCKKYYVVKAGDICWSISLNNEMTVEALQKENPNMECNNLQIGEKLCLSRKEDSAPKKVTANDVISAPKEEVRCLATMSILKEATCLDAVKLIKVISVQDLELINPDLNCENPLPIGKKVCINKQGIFRCDNYHVWREGDTIPKVSMEYSIPEVIFKQVLNENLDTQVLAPGNRVCIGRTTTPEAPKKTSSRGCFSLNSQCNKIIGGYFTNWDFYNTNMKSLDVQKLSMYTHIMYAFLSISYSKEYNVWYLDTNDPSADFLIPVESYLGDCMTFSKNLECRTGIVSLVPQLGAGSETKVCPKSTCFNGGGSNETSRECHVQISLPISGGKPKVCGQINHILNKLPHVAPNSYVLFTIGGWYDSNYWTKAVSPNYVHQFITSIISWLNALPFDGVDINWEHPGYEHEGQPMPGRSMVKGNPDFIRNCKDTKCDEEGRVTDTDNLLVFIEQLRKKLYTAGVNSMGLTRHGTPYQISIAVSAIPAVTHAWNISKICRLVDRINLMTYDYTGGWSPRTGHQSALYSAERNCKSESGEFSVECSVDFWIRNGCPREKIIIGVPSYARIFKNVSFGDNPEFPGYHQAHSGLETQTIQGYQKILQDPEFRHYWDENAKASFSYSQTKSEFATYDTQKGVQEKAKWVKANRLGGMMIWKMGEDDPNNHLIRTARNELLTFP